MEDLERSLRRIRDDLDDLGRPWVLVGALAVAARAEARATLDVDVALAVADRADAEELVESLVERGYRWKASFGHAMTSLLVPDPDAPPVGLRLDLLFSMVGIEDRVAKEGERLAVLPDLEFPVARRGDLITLKLFGARQPGREHDRRDLRFLLEAADSEDLERARASIALMERRGIVERDVLEEELKRELSKIRSDPDLGS